MGFLVQFIDFAIGAESGYIRFESEGAAQKARAAGVLAEEGGLAVKNFIAVLDPVTGGCFYSISRIALILSIDQCLFVQ